MFCWAWLKKLLYRRLLTSLLVFYFIMVVCFLLSLDSDSTTDNAKSLEYLDEMLPQKQQDPKMVTVKIQNLTITKIRSKSKEQINSETMISVTDFGRTKVKLTESLPFLTPNLFVKSDSGNGERFVPLGIETYAYSVFLDDRKELNFIRIMTLRSVSASNMQIFCHFTEILSLDPVLSLRYEMCENHDTKFGGYIYSCPVPKMVNTSKLRTIVLSTTKFGSKVDMPLLTIRPPEEKLAYLDLYSRNSPVTGSSTLVYNKNVVIKNINSQNVSTNTSTKTPVSSTPLSFAICVSPLYGSASPYRLMEFVELSRLLGAQHFIFYRENVTAKVSDVLQHYSNQKIASVLPWTLPENVNDIWNYGQLLANNDCLYRTMPHFDLVSFIDVDEFIVPHTKASTWREAFSVLLTREISGLSFQSAFFNLGIRDSMDTSLQTPVLKTRTQMFSKVRTKVMLFPWRVFEVGIHHMSKQNRESWQIYHVPPDVAYIHHYRYCLSNYGMRCDYVINDSIIADRYSTELSTNYQTVLTNIASLGAKKTA